MNNKKRFIILAAVFAVIIAVAGFAYGRLILIADTPNNFVETEENAQQVEENKADGDEVPKFKATDFTIADWEGNSVNLSDFEGKPVIVNFWASWCGPCQMEMPDFEEKYQQYSEDIHFLMVNVTDGGRETVDTAKAFIEGTDYTFPVYFDTELDASNTYSVYSLPTTLFIDAEGYGIAQATGMISAELLQKGIDMIYAPAE